MNFRYFQFTIPLILSFLLIQNIMDNPDGSLAFWMSIIPFTSPVIMMVRLPFGVDSFDLFLSMITLIISFISIAWIASKIYRVETKKQTNIFRRSIVAEKKIQKGEKISTLNISLKRPGNGLQPKFFKKILGKKAKKNIKKGSLVKLSDF